MSRPAIPRATGFSGLARTLDEMQAIANDLAREKAIRPVIGKLRLSRDWRDLGALKRELIDYWIGERNALFKRVVEDMEARKGEGRPGG